MSHSQLLTPSLATFRDPAGSVHRAGDRIFRVVSPSGVPSLERFLRSRTASDLRHRGQLVETQRISADGSRESASVPAMRPERDGSAIYEHSRVWFPSYAYEWPAEMLYAAAEFTLDIVESLLPEAFGLKDATPFNILFDRGHPVFVDLCSFEDRAARDPIWLGCGQFERMFLVPLLAARRLGMDPRLVLGSNLDGMEASRMRQCFSGPQVLYRDVFSIVTVPSLLNRVAESMFEGSAPAVRNLEATAAKRVLHRLFRDLRKKLQRVRPKSRASVWSGYDPAAADVNAKSELVERVLHQMRPRTVLDVGCNRGTYSRIACDAGARVVALDSDATVVGRFWREVEAEHLDILPLHLDFAKPTPGLGWRNSEYLSFNERAAHRFDAVLMLAVLHHIVVRDRIPLEQILEIAAQYATKCLVIEFVSTQDPMFRRISSGRESLFQDHREDRFVAAAERFFRITDKVALPSGTRTLYVMEKL